jgi:hypothetical protein
VENVLRNAVKLSNLFAVILTKNLLADRAILSLHVAAFVLQGVWSCWLLDGCGGRGKRIVLVRNSKTNSNLIVRDSKSDSKSRIDKVYSWNQSE